MLQAEALGILQGQREELAKALALQITEVQAKLDAVKPLYIELESLTLALKDLMGVGVEVTISEERIVMINGAAVFLPPQVVKVVDNFAEKNTAFRTAAVKRFEMNSETLEERRQRLEKEAKKAAKAKA